MSSFHPHPLLRGPHAQTIGAMYLPGAAFPYRARRHHVTLDDGDTIVLHDDRPPNWNDGDRVAVLVHGLAGCHLSRYVVRVAGRLNQHGLRTFRMDQRGCGAGATLARLPFHSGRSDDLAAALKLVAEICPGAPLAVVGFSMGGNIALKLLGEDHLGVPEQLDRAVAVGPPTDLAACAAAIDRRGNRVYRRHLLRTLLRGQRVRERNPEAVRLESQRRPRTIRELDDVFTAPVCGFGDADTYYRQCSSGSSIQNIRVPTRILTARDDPLVPYEQFERLDLPSSIDLTATDGGGHLGFLGRRNHDPDRRWMDWRVVDWLTDESSD